MSVIHINKNTVLEDTFPEYLDYHFELKELYGEINTPFVFIQQMLSIIPKRHFENKNLKWLDPGSGHGNYSLCLFFILFKSLHKSIPNKKERMKHIIENMIYMVELNSSNIPFLREKFGEKGNIIEENYLEWTPDFQFDFIIGNPPYNFNGVKKVPTKQNVDKKEDGKTIWCEFVKKNISLLKENGIMNILIPSIWMKPDKAGMYEFFLKYDIQKLHTLSSSETNKTFGFHVQTPTCYFLLCNRENQDKIELYDSLSKKYTIFNLDKNIPIPLDFASIINKFLKLTHKYGKINVIKTNLPKKGIQIVDYPNVKYPFKNVKTTTLNKNKCPELQFMYSNEQLAYYNQPKIIMAHKMYGFPYIDKDGSFGICARDNYIILNKEIKEMELMKEFLSTELILFVFETTRYRMRYLEKYVFEYIPDFSKIDECWDMFNQHKIDVYKLFDITKQEQYFIENYYNIKYKFFP
jgi:hypothetical protein